ncbi:NAD(+)--rifampin ADP-ribosyltransferase [Pedobacter sp. SYP-B3415]|uniref:NAD(+)--rifampin ADP-ribosyltransferase n=1 Tax=Pedobacter sp. SYP-B3415 TaxID=2496641 RepID=UPI00101C1832|nr:NAD(+)--rifampin ADP-ribosyltransferase [Pedobacter sp. SYP-B3415]
MANPSTTNQKRSTPDPFKQTYFHGTKADLNIGDLIETGYVSNFVNRKLKHIYLASTLSAAIWGAELASGSGRQRIYLVEATGPLEDDPNVTDKKFPGNPTMSYRSESPFRVIGEVTVWQGHTPEQIQLMKEGVAQLRQSGAELIEE